MNTKVMTAIGAGALVLSLGYNTADAQEQGTVTASALNVRSAPGTENKVVSCLNKGDTVLILEKDNGWLKVQLPNKITGWVSEKYISASETVSNIKVNCSTRLNVRTGPSTKYSIKTSISNGQIFKVLEKSNNWYKIQVDSNTTGWVSGSYVVETNESTSNDSNTTQESDEIKETEVNLNGKVSCSTLNVRSGPGTNYSIKTSVKSGQVVIILSEYDGWYKVKLSNGITGWASSKYISKTTTYGKVSSSSLNVRSGPSTSYSIKTSLKSGQIITITDKSNSWYEIKTTSNVTGWVSAQYIELTTQEPGSDFTENSGNSSNNETNGTNEEKNEALVNLALSFLGTPYSWGANGPNSFDCSGFTRYVYLNARGISLPRVSYEQAKAGKAVSTSNLQKGDLLHFATVTPGTTSHVGIYIGNNQFVHASGSKTKPDKVKISSLSGYYGKVLLGARRFD